MSKIVLIDGDSILYRVAFRGEELCEVSPLDDEIVDYVVATGVGGVMEHPDIVYENEQLIEADSPEEAVAIYNKKNNCTFYYGEVVRTVGTGRMRSNNDDGMDGMVDDGIHKEYAYSGDYSLHLPSSYSAIEYSIKNMVDAWNDHLEGIESIERVSGVEIYMTGKPGRLHCENLKPNFRDSYVDDYKSNRKDSRPPAGLAELWAHIFSITELNGIPVTVRVADGSEADDIVVYLKKMEPLKYLLCALDKDVLYQSAGYHYNYGKELFEQVSALEATKYLYFQMINGDPSDGYKGVPGVGKVGATKALDRLTDPVEMWETTLALYKKKGLGLGEAIQTGILASMHQVTHVEFDGLVARPTIELFKALK